MPTGVLLGAGALSLGFLTPALAERDLEVVIAGRIAESVSKDRYERIARRQEIRIRYFDGDVKIPISRFIDVSTAAGMDALADQLAASETLLVVTASRSGLAAFWPALLDAAPRRATPLHFISADNVPEQLFLDAAARSEPLAAWHDSVADRACVPPLEDTGDVDVFAERYGHWVIADNSGLAHVLDASRGSQTLVEYVDGEDLARFRKRKLWIVNGVHLAVSAGAVSLRYALIPDYLTAASSNGNLAAREVASAMAHAVHAVEPRLPLPDLLAFASAVVDRFATEPDYALRVLGSRRGKPPSRQELEAKIAARLVEPTDALHRAGKPHLANVLRCAADLASAICEEIAQ